MNWNTDNGLGGLSPSAWLGLATLLVLLIGLSLAFGRGGPRDMRGRRTLRIRPVRRLIGLLCLALAVLGGGLALTLYQFFRLTTDTPVASVSFSKASDGVYSAAVALSGSEPRSFELRGDEWQIDARVVRWSLPALLAGVPPLYRFERLSGRYEDAAAEQTAPRTVYALVDSPVPDLGTVKRRYPRWLPFVDVQFGSAAYMPMFDGARYGVFLDPRGALFVRPADDATAAGLKQRGW
jgi:hypothetical protein